MKSEVIESLFLFRPITTKTLLSVIINCIVLVRFLLTQFEEIIYALAPFKTHFESIKLFLKNGCGNFASYGLKCGE